MNLKQLQAQFERSKKAYSVRQEHFKKCIEKWKKSGFDELATRGEYLISSAQDHVKEIEKSLMSASSDAACKTLYKKIKSFKTVLKELNESTKPEWRQWIEAFLFALSLVFVIRNYFFGLYHVPTGSAEPTMLVGDRVCGNKLIYRVGYKPSHGDLVMFDDPNFKYDESHAINRVWQKYIGFGIPLLGLSDGPQNFVKRVIGVPGDTMEGKLEDGKAVIYRNSKKLDEVYVNPYPLIGLEKKTGFFDFDRLGFFPIPSFLQKVSKPVFYTYDPKKEFSDQPYYNMSSEEVLLEPGTLRPWLKFSSTPTKNQFGRVVDVFGPITLPEGKYWVMGDSRKNSADCRFFGMLDESFIHGRASFVLYSVDSEEPLWLFELIKNPFMFWTKSVRWNRFFKGLGASYTEGNRAPIQEKAQAAAPAQPVVEKKEIALPLPLQAAPLS